MPQGKNTEIAIGIKEFVNMFKNEDEFRISKLNDHIGFLISENNKLVEELKQMKMDIFVKKKTNSGILCKNIPRMNFNRTLCYVLICEENLYHTIHLIFLQS